MTRRATLVLALLFGPATVGGCASENRGDESTEPPRSTATDGETTDAREARSPLASPYPLYFWITPRFYGTPAARLGEGHPCGLVVSMPVSTIPEFPDDGMFEASIAFEYDEQGRTVRRWALPVDTQIYALDSSSLLVQPVNYWGTDEYFWITTEGRIGATVLDHTPDLPQALECPASVTVAHHCFALRDATSEEPHMLAAEMTCT